MAGCSLADLERLFKDYVGTEFSLAQVLSATSSPLQDETPDSPKSSLLRRQHHEQFPQNMKSPGGQHQPAAHAWPYSSQVAADWCIDSHVHHELEEQQQPALMRDEPSAWDLHVQAALPRQPHGTAAAGLTSPYTQGAHALNASTAYRSSNQAGRLHTGRHCNGRHKQYASSASAQARKYADMHLLRSAYSAVQPADELWESGAQCDGAGTDGNAVWGFPQETGEHDTELYYIHGRSTARSTACTSAAQDWHSQSSSIATTHRAGSAALSRAEADYLLHRGQSPGRVRLFGRPSSQELTSTAGSSCTHSTVGWQQSQAGLRQSQAGLRLNQAGLRLNQAGLKERQPGNRNRMQSACSVQVSTAGPHREQVPASALACSAQQRNGYPMPHEDTHPGHETVDLAPGPSLKGIHQLWRQPQQADGPQPDLSLFISPQQYKAHAQPAPCRVPATMPRLQGHHGHVREHPMPTHLDTTEVGGWYPQHMGSSRTSQPGWQTESHFDSTPTKTVPCMDRQCGPTGLQHVQAAEQLNRTDGHVHFAHCDEPWQDSCQPAQEQCMNWRGPWDMQYNSTQGMPGAVGHSRQDDSVLAGAGPRTPHKAALLSIKGRMRQAAKMLHTPSSAGSVPHQPVDANEHRSHQPIQVNQHRQHQPMYIRAQGTHQPAQLEEHGPQQPTCTSPQGPHPPVRNNGQMLYPPIYTNGQGPHQHITASERKQPSPLVLQQHLQSTAYSMGPKTESWPVAGNRLQQHTTQQGQYQAPVVVMDVLVPGQGRRDQAAANRRLASRSSSSGGNSEDSSGSYSSGSSEDSRRLYAHHGVRRLWPNSHPVPEAAKNKSQASAAKPTQGCGNSSSKVDHHSVDGVRGAGREGCGPYVRQEQACQEDWQASLQQAVFEEELQQAALEADMQPLVNLEQLCACAEGFLGTWPHPDAQDTGSAGDTRNGLVCDTAVRGTDHAPARPHKGYEGEGVHVLQQWAEEFLPAELGSSQCNHSQQRPAMSRPQHEHATSGLIKQYTKAALTCGNQLLAQLPLPAPLDVLQPTALITSPPSSHSSWSAHKSAKKCSAAPWDMSPSAPGNKQMQPHSKQVGGSRTAVVATRSPSCALSEMQMQEQQAGRAQLKQSASLGSPGTEGPGEGKRVAPWLPSPCMSSDLRDSLEGSIQSLLFGHQPAAQAQGEQQVGTELLGPTSSKLQRLLSPQAGVKEDVDSDRGWQGDQDSSGQRTSPCTVEWMVPATAWDSKPVNVPDSVPASQNNSSTADGMSPCRGKAVDSQHESMSQHGVSLLDLQQGTMSPHDTRTLDLQQGSMSLGDDSRSEVQDDPAGLLCGSAKAGLMLQDDDGGARGTQQQHKGCSSTQVMPCQQVTGECKQMDALGSCHDSTAKGQHKVAQSQARRVVHASQVKRVASSKGSRNPPSSSDAMQGSQRRVAVGCHVPGGVTSSAKKARAQPQHNSSTSKAKHGSRSPLAKQSVGMKAAPAHGYEPSHVPMHQLLLVPQQHPPTQTLHQQQPLTPEPEASMDAIPAEPWRPTQVTSSIPHSPDRHDSSFMQALEATVVDPLLAGSTVYKEDGHASKVDTASAVTDDVVQMLQAMTDMPLEPSLSNPGSQDGTEATTTAAAQADQAWPVQHHLEPSAVTASTQHAQADKAADPPQTHLGEGKLVSIATCGHNATAKLTGTGVCCSRRESTSCFERPAQTASDSGSAAVGLAEASVTDGDMPEVTHCWLRAPITLHNTPKAQLLYEESLQELGALAPHGGSPAPTAVATLSAGAVGPQPDPDAQQPILVEEEPASPAPTGAAQEQASILPVPAAVLQEQELAPPLTATVLQGQDLLQPVQAVTLQGQELVEPVVLTPGAGVPTHKPEAAVPTQEPEAVVSTQEPVVSTQQPKLPTAATVMLQESEHAVFKQEVVQQGPQVQQPGPVTSPPTAGSLLPATEQTDHIGAVMQGAGLDHILLGPSACTARCQELEPQCFTAAEHPAVQDTPKLEQLKCDSGAPDSVELDRPEQEQPSLSDAPVEGTGEVVPGGVDQQNSSMSASAGLNLQVMRAAGAQAQADPIDVVLDVNDFRTTAECSAGRVQIDIESPSGQPAPEDGSSHSAAATVPPPAVAITPVSILIPAPILLPVPAPALTAESVPISADALQSSPTPASVSVPAATPATTSVIASLPVPVPVRAPAPVPAATTATTPVTASLPVAVPVPAPAPVLAAQSTAVSPGSKPPRSARKELKAVEPVLAEIRAIKAALPPAKMALLATQLTTSNNLQQVEMPYEQLQQLAALLEQLPKLAPAAAPGEPPKPVAAKLLALHRDLMHWAEPVLRPLGLLPGNSSPASDEASSSPAVCFHVPAGALSSNSESIGQAAASKRATNVVDGYGGDAAAGQKLRSSRCEAASLSGGIAVDEYALQGPAGSQPGVSASAEDTCGFSFPTMTHPSATAPMTTDSDKGPDSSSTIRPNAEGPRPQQADSLSSLAHVSSKAALPATAPSSCAASGSTSDGGLAASVLQPARVSPAVQHWPGVTMAVGSSTPKKQHSEAAHVACTAPIMFPAMGSLRPMGSLNMAVAHYQTNASMLVNSPGQQQQGLVAYGAGMGVPGSMPMSLSDLAAVLNQQTLQMQQAAAMSNASSAGPGSPLSPKAAQAAPHGSPAYAAAHGSTTHTAAHGSAAHAAAHSSTTHTAAHGVPVPVVAHQSRSVGGAAGGQGIGRGVRSNHTSTPPRPSIMAGRADIHSPPGVLVLPGQEQQPELVSCSSSSIGSEEGKKRLSLKNKLAKLFSSKQK